MAALAARGDRFDDTFATFLGILDEGAWAEDPRPPANRPGLRLDPGAAFAHAEGAAAPETEPPVWLTLDLRLQVPDSLPMAGPDGGAQAPIARLSALPRAARHAGFAVQAPILALPRSLGPVRDAAPCVAPFRPGPA